MVYIDAYSHAQITQNGSKHVVMSTSGDDIVLKDYLGNKIHLTNKDNIAYDVTKQPDMLSYNKGLLKTLSA